MPDPDLAYDAYRLADERDRQHAASLAVRLDDRLEGFTRRADAVYAWLRARPTVAPHKLVITPGIPQDKPLEGAAMTTPVPGTLSITDQQTDSLTVSAVDALGFSTPDAGPFTWSVDNTAVASVTDNGDGTATISPVAPGTANVACSDANGIQATPLAVSVEPGEVNALVITAGTPTP